VTDQAVDTSGTRLSADGRSRATATASTDGQFLGRTRELKELLADIERAGLDTIAGKKPPSARVLLIAGRPGSGRTALAEELVRRIAHRYPDGVLRARLTDPDGTPVPTDRAARALLDALEVPAPAGAPAEDLSADLRAALADRRALLLLDGATDAEQVDELLPPAPDSLVLTVTERPLTGLVDVRPCTLGGLDTKTAVELLTHWTGTVRVTVDPCAAEGLVEECGAQPAALVLAGGWLAARPKVSVADLAKQLRARADDGPVLARVFHHAYEALPAPSARILRLLGLTPGGLADPHTASALAGCSVSAARTLLDDFTALGMLRRVPSPLPQYQVPDCLVPLLRVLREAKDRPGEVQLARARMLERTVRLLQSCRAITQTDDAAAQERLAGLPRSLRFPHPRAAAEWLRIRRPALLAAARAAVADGELDTLARRLMAALTRALVAHEGAVSAAADLYAIHQLVLDVARRRDLPREEAAALLNLADLDTRTGRTGEALTRYRSALDAARRARDPYATGRATESIGGAHQELGDWYRAADWYGRALAHRLARDERDDAARLHGRIAGVQTYAGRYGDAMRNWRSAISGHRRSGDTPAVARALSELARVQEYAGRPEESLQTCRQAVEWARRAEDVRLQAALQLRLADTLDRLGESSAARLHRSAAERMLQQEFPPEEDHPVPGEAPAPESGRPRAALGPGDEPSPAAESEGEGSGPVEEQRPGGGGTDGDAETATEAAEPLATYEIRSGARKD
jgi:tetratricopeptide (TPR) repeat protein